MKRMSALLFGTLLSFPLQAQDVQRVPCGDPKSGLPFIKFCGGQTEVFEFNMETMELSPNLAPYVSFPYKRKSETSRMLMRSAVVDKSSASRAAALALKPDLSKALRPDFSEALRPDFSEALRTKLTSSRIREVLAGRLISRDIIWEVIRDTDFTAHDRVYRQTKDEMPSGVMAMGRIPAPMASIPDDFRANARAEVTLDVELDGSLDSKNYAPGDTGYVLLYMQQINKKSAFKSNSVRIIKADFRNEKEGGMTLASTLKSIKLQQGPNDDGDIQISIIPIPAAAKFATETADKVKKPNLGKQRLNIRLKRVSVQVNYFTT